MFDEAEVERISEEHATTTVAAINQKFHEEIESFGAELSQKMIAIREVANRLIGSFELYEAMTKTLTAASAAGSIAKIDADLQKRELQLQLIYDDFFILQNLINAYAYQKIIMTYVHVDPIDGTREIRIFDNDASQLQAMIVNNHGRSYAKLGYYANKQYEILKNSLSEQENEGLQETAAEVERRYVKYKGKILWQTGDEWVGYHLTNRGPINEAYADFYIKEVKLMQEAADNLHYFMTSIDPHGVIQADNANGFLIGDLSLGGLQFAVKGQYGSAQGFSQIVAWLKKVRDEDFSPEALQMFISRFKEQEEEKATSLVKPLTKRSISGMIRYHGEEILANGLWNQKN